MNTIKQGKYNVMGYLWGKNSEPRTWLQFADDAAVISNNDKNAQVLLDLFTAFCSWADMKIRVDKCYAFGMRKENSNYVQYKPLLFVNGSLIPQIECKCDFKYLGKLFNFDMNTDSIKAQLKIKLQSLLSKVTQAKLKPQTKLKVLKLAIISRLSFDLKTYDLGTTWVSAELDLLIREHIRNWLELPISTCVDEVMRLSSSKCGMDITSLKDYYTILHIGKRHSLKNSSNSDIQALWKSTIHANIETEEILCNHTSVNSAIKSTKNSFQVKALEHIRGLQLQGASITSVIDNMPTKSITDWSKITTQLPSLMFKFARKAIMNQLATNANLKRWGKSNNDNCPLCHVSQTNKHVLNNCSAEAALDRYKVRHDAILHIMGPWLLNMVKAGAKLFMDIPGYNSPSVIFHNLRPDIAVTLNNRITILELTVCHEINILQSRKFKQDKYKNISRDLKPDFEHMQVEIHSLEVTSLGFVSNINAFCKATLNVNSLVDSILESITKTTIGNSYNIYKNRNSDN